MISVVFCYWLQIKDFICTGLSSSPDFEDRILKYWKREAVLNEGQCTTADGKFFVKECRIDENYHSCAASVNHK